MSSGLGPPLVRAQLLAFLAAIAACAGARDPADRSDALQLLARGPDALLEQPGILLPHEDLPGTLTWGPCEGPGWSQELHRRDDGALYLVTNQPVASLCLPATRPADRQLVLELWRPRSERPSGGAVELFLNGVRLTALELEHEPEVERVDVPSAAWALGENELELRVPRTDLEGVELWGEVALARVEYGTELRVRTDREARTAELPSGAGLRYCVALSGAAELFVEGHADGPGTLELHLGDLELASGERRFDPHWIRIPAEDGRLRARAALDGARARVVELVWTSPTGARATLERLDVEEREPHQRPPIVFVSIDTFAARHLSLHGYSRETTPELEELARHAVVFEHCVANAPWTLPSYLSVLTGLYPRSHHVALHEGSGAQLGSLDWWQVADSRWTIGEALRARGYSTGAFVDTHWLSTQWRASQGFDVYDGSAALLPFEDPGAGIRLLVEGLGKTWLAQRSPDVPFFLFLHALDAHGPYWPEPPFRDAFPASSADAREVPVGSTNLTYHTMPAWMGRTLVADPAQPLPAELPLEPIVARYDEALLKVDAYLGMLFDDLKERGLFERSVIVITGDHGESFAHDLFGHGVLWEDVLHVPLIVKLPGNEAGGARIEETVQLVDVVPTLLELAGSPLPENLHGCSLLPLIRNGERTGRPAFSEGGHVEQYALQDGGWKLIEVFPGRESGDVSLLTHPRAPRDWLDANFPELLSQPLTDALKDELRARPGYEEKLAELRALIAGPYYELYDLAHDPGETKDLSRVRPDVLERLRRVLEREKGRARAAREEARPGVRPQLSEEALRALGDLGYAAAED